MSPWVFTVRERLTSARPNFESYQAFSGFSHITELVSLDGMMCPNLITELTDEDWQHNIHEDLRSDLFRKPDYLLARQPLDPTLHQVIAACENPDGTEALPDRFTFCGYDIMDSFFGISTLTNCGPIPEVFSPEDVNEFGLLDDLQMALSVGSKMRAHQPDDPHLGDCRVWRLARRLPRLEDQTTSFSSS
ncbi:MAG: hypothetical protein ACPGVU_06920 [Limisphaerales bacterium]